MCPRSTVNVDLHQERRNPAHLALCLYFDLRLSGLRKFADKNLGSGNDLRKVLDTSDDAVQKVLTAVVTKPAESVANAVTKPVVNVVNQAGGTLHKGCKFVHKKC